MSYFEILSAHTFFLLDTLASKKTKKASNNKSATAAMNTPLKSKPASTSLYLSEVHSYPLKFPTEARKHGAKQVNVDMPEEGMIITLLVMNVNEFIQP